MKPDELKKLYLDNEAQQCLHCQKKNVETIEAGLTEDGTEVRRTRECHDCGKLWHDFFGLKRVEFDKENNDKEKDIGTVYLPTP